jgi:hypothetical protein
MQIIIFRLAAAGGCPPALTRVPSEKPAVDPREKVPGTEADSAAGTSCFSAGRREPPTDIHLSIVHGIEDCTPDPSDRFRSAGFLGYIGG